MFQKKEKCPKCEKPVNRDWSYCPFCGYPLKESYEKPTLFHEFMDFEELDRLFEKRMRELDELFKMNFKIPRIKIPSSGFSGISITIHGGTGMKPRIEVKTYGEMKKYEPEIKRKLGVEKVEVVEESEEEKPPKITEEPEAKISNLGDKMVVEVDLPDVESEDQIKIVPLEQSLEIRARTKDKLYFKLLPIRGNVIKKEFKKGKLRIELERE